MFRQPSGAPGQGQRGPDHVWLRPANCCKEPAECGNSGAGRLRATSERLDTMLDAARRLMTPSARSDVPPFMVMDVMAAAARIEAAGGRVVHMEVGQPAAAAPSTAIAAVRAALGDGRARLHRDARHSVAARAHRAALSETVRHRGRSGRDRRHHRLVGRLHPGVSGDVRAGRPGRDRQSRLSAVSPHPHRARLRAGADRDRRGDALGDHRRNAAARRIASTPLTGVLVASPANPTGTMMTRRGAARADRRRRGRRHPGDLRRNLSRPRLRVAGRDRRAAVGPTRWSSIRSRNISA